MDFTFEKIKKTMNKVDGNMRVSTIPIKNAEWTFCEYKTGHTPPEDSSWIPLEQKPQIKGECHGWIKAELDVPAEWNGKTVFFFNDSEVYGNKSSLPQTIVYIDGELFAAFDTFHRYFSLEEICGKHDLLLYVYLPEGQQYINISYNLSLMDDDIIGLYYDLRAPHDVMSFTKKDTREYGLIRDCLSSACDLLDLRSVEALRETAPKAREYLKEHFYNELCGKEEIECACIGHTHIDVAWLWPVRQTREKVQRSFATVLNMMRRFPDYKFMSSQPQLYKFLKEEAPELYEKVKEQVKAGRWEVEGAMWLEADCNLISGESLVRQIIYGKRFIREEFGRDSRVLWLPDVFGYSAALPQILKKSGVDYFVTSKISWNEANKLPCDIFMWKGIDGTEVKSYFLTAQKHESSKAEPKTYVTYNATTEPAMIRGAWERFQQKDILNDVLVTCGFGDGGGGPTYEMVELERRESYGMPGCPKTRFEFSADFLDGAFDKVKNSKNLPSWTGELYLEFHRGTYTSQAQNKRNNRKSEFLLQQAETAALTDMLLLGGKYPTDTLRSLWETVLLNQFHDILPGSSIHEVYEVSEKEYEKVIADGNKIKCDALSSISANIKTDGGTLVFNPNSFTASDVVNVGGKCVYVEDIPAKGWKVIHPVISDSVVISSDLRHAENDFFDVVFDENMNIARLFDKRAKRDVLKAGSVGNELLAFEDYPREYDAWEITNYYEDKMWKVNDVASVELVEDGERKGVKYTKRFDISSITQTVWLYSHKARVDFETEIDWKNDHILLKSAFPLAINTDTATFDIQYGNVKRPTHRNTSWDQAKFEVCAHKFVDVSEYGYGVSMLNDCKYGYDVHDSTLRITMLKSATYPDPAADKRKHFFTYSLFPHTGDFRQAGTYKEAYLLNQPLSAVEIKAQSGKLPDAFSLASADSDNVYFETLKLSEDGKSVVLRLYDAFNSTNDVAISFGFDFKAAYICDLLENKLFKADTDGRKVTLNIKPFEIVTLMLEI